MERTARPADRCPSTSPVGRRADLVVGEPQAIVHEDGEAPVSGDRMTGLLRGVRRRQNAGERTLSVAPPHSVPYLGEMLIRLSALLALAFSGCGFQSGVSPENDPALSETEQTLSCGDSKYLCDPIDPGSNGECEQACEASGHCMDHSAGEIAWCAAHPDRFYSPLKRCGPTGKPLWRTWCVPGPPP